MHPILRVEEADSLLILVDAGSAPPYSPEVYISFVKGVLRGHRASWDVAGIGVQVLYQLRYGGLEDLFVHVESRLMSGAPTPLDDTLLYLIISAPEHHARVIPKSSNLFPYLNPHALKEFLSWRVKCVAKHKVMPEHNAH